MSLDSMQVASPLTDCKCCDGASRLCGVVDFSRCGADHQAGAKVDPFAGVPVYYYRCEACGFVFTRALDAWTHEDYAAHIYNDDYVRHDPDYLGKRPSENGEMIAKNFPEMAEANLLDFGSGLGLLEKELKARGFGRVDSYDPYTASAAARASLAAAYRTVLAFEVFEHHPQPRALMAELAGFLDDDGAVLFSTMMAGDAVMAEGIERWWYCAPRNGHISFFAPRTLARLAAQHGLVAGSFNENFHFFYKRSLPAWAARFSHQICSL
ncbi:class I SAM-dependent methyltransferase [Burkholderia alba]|uniref:class I SAM-dependent methyltransferase n=1 Tax=Burkholderia alba TaxID=2683677 RepID=UPI002B05EFC1|nr:class I SAM-dependent methyltransferase [Burkholderia alba]